MVFNFRDVEVRGDVTHTATLGHVQYSLGWSMKSLNVSMSVLETLVDLSKSPIYTYLSAEGIPSESSILSLYCIFQANEASASSDGQTMHHELAHSQYQISPFTEGRVQSSLASLT